MMHDTIIQSVTMTLAWAWGLLLGTIFFGGLWWTVQSGLSSKWSALWFAGSQLLRTSIVLVGFYLVSLGHWERLLICLVGFVMARLVVMRFSQRIERAACFAREDNDAHNS